MVNNIPNRLQFLSDMKIIIAPIPKIEPSAINDSLAIFPTNPKTIDIKETILLGIAIIAL